MANWIMCMPCILAWGLWGGIGIRCYTNPSQSDLTAEIQHTRHKDI